MKWETNFYDFSDVQTAPSLINAMKNPTSTPLYVRAVYSATCNSGLVGVYSPGLAFIVCSVLSFHFELYWAVVIRSWLCLQLMQSERNITFISQYLKSQSRNLFMIFLIHMGPSEFFRSVTDEWQGGGGQIMPTTVLCARVHNFRPCDGP